MCLVGIFRACLFCVIINGYSIVKLKHCSVAWSDDARTLYACLSEHLFTISCCTFLRGINVNVWTLAIAPLTRVSDQ